MVQCPAKHRPEHHHSRDPAPSRDYWLNEGIVLGVGVVVVGLIIALAMAL